MDANHELCFMDRSNHAKSAEAIGAGVEVLKQGHSLVIFPEGTRSKGGPVQRLKAGSVRLAMDAMVPIVPIHNRRNSRYT